MIEGNRIIIQADNSKLTVEQIAEHEIGHAEETAELNEESAKLIRERFSEEEFAAVVDAYIRNLEGYSKEEIISEIVQDARAGINNFGKETAKYKETVREVYDRARNNAVSQEANGERETRGPGAKYSLDEYSKTQIDNWKNSKTIIIFRTKEQIKEFVEKSRYDGNYVKKIYFGVVGEKLGNEIKEKTGFNLKGRNVTLRAGNVRKIFKDHGTEKTEKPRGQRPITNTDFELIPEIIGTPDTISKGEYEGKPAVEFKKKVDGSNITVFAVDSGSSSLDLFVQTMYAGIKKGSIAGMANASTSTRTSETTAGTASFGSRIAETSEESKRNLSSKEKQAKFSRGTDAEYLELVKDPEGNKEELQEMVDEKAIR